MKKKLWEARLELLKESIEENDFPLQNLFVGILQPPNGPSIELYA